VGTIVGHFGVRGELKVAALDEEAFEAGRQVQLDRPGAAPGAPRRASFTIASARRNQKLLLVQLEGIADVAAARALVGSAILMDRKDLGNGPAGTYRAADLIGFAVRDGRLGALGQVTAVRRYPACDMLVVGASGKLIPMLSAYGFSVDTKAREIAVDLPLGFEEL
jgi:16S rRNA processing protein RimM